MIKQLLLAAIVGCCCQWVRADYSLTTLGSFSSSRPLPTTSPLVFDKNGNLYGSDVGGTPLNNGDVFELASGSNTVNILANLDGTHGAEPAGRLVIDDSGNVFGTAVIGGSRLSQGTVFEITGDAHALSALVNFTMIPTNPAGLNPVSGLISDQDGNFYGATTGDTITGGGRIFKLAAGTRALTVVSAFSLSAPDGNTPVGGVIADADGNLYGMTQRGGANGVGTIYEYSASAQTRSTLASFDKVGGVTPNPSFFNGLTMDASGNLYGTLPFVQDSGQAPVIFELPAGGSSITILANTPDHLNESVFADAAGDLFGTTQSGGTYGKGTVFEIPAGTTTVTTIYSFDASNYDPDSNLLIDPAGNLYGTTRGGGANNFGAVFELSNVPEPSNLLMMGIISVGLLSRRRYLA